MNVLQQMSEKSKQLGCIPGENAKQWRERDPKAALAFAEFIKANQAAITKAIAGALCAS